MGYLLSGTTLKAPSSVQESNSTQYAQHRTLRGRLARDYMGDNKRIWTLNYDKTNPTDYAIIKAIYDSYLSTGTAKTFQITETNYTVSQTTVHVDLLVRQFDIRGESYISGFTLTLTEV
ncbi:hypothetical protein UFOVP585_44 [uncultured Caudovirales phage]|uniref:Uncharacterized protein n=1 Tax=uncultured Caudovirales phage TaxID=2100421 RepID=A0A6J5MXB6_9CAUD|nr:hypothetical protein UFOVP585_44 [uncultured Caudovirales phage]